MAHIYSVTGSATEKDGRKVYSVTRNDGALYEVHSAHKGLPCEVVTLVKRADGGRNWRWASDITKGVPSAVVACVEAFINHVAQETAKVLAVMPIKSETVSPVPVNVQTWDQLSMIGCFLACARMLGVACAKKQKPGVTFKPAAHHSHTMGMTSDKMLNDTFVSGFVFETRGAYPGGVPVNESGVIVARGVIPSARIIGVGLIA